jgi:hypothetical protein
MVEIDKQAVILKHESAGSSPAEMHVQVFDSNDRTKRAIKALLICWGLSLASLPIIFAHWVLVPGFFIAGPFAAYRYYNISSVPKKIAGVCPSCGQQMELALETSDTLPMWRYCSACNASLHIEAIEPGSD